MLTQQIQNDPIINVNIPVVSGLIISNDPTTPLTKLDISAGICSDSNNAIIMTVGVPPIIGVEVTPPIVINALVNGVNGLDTGSLVASRTYSVFIIGDSRGIMETAAILSMMNRTTLIQPPPLMPFGYDSYRRIGSVSTDGSAHFSVFTEYGNGVDKTFLYATPINALNGGNATLFTPIVLINMVPNIPCIPYVQGIFTAAAAGDLFSLRQSGQTSAIGASVIECGPAVATQQADMIPFNIFTGVNAGRVSIDYAVTASGDSFSLDVLGWMESL